MTEAPTTKSAAWIQRVIAENPCRALSDGTDNIVTCPVRLGFPYLVTPQKPQDEDGGKPKYSATLLFQPGSNIDVIKAAMAAKAQAEWGTQLEQFMAMDNFHKPIKDQRIKAYDGFVPGLPCITATANYLDKNGSVRSPPPVVMQNMAPYTGRIYPGIWAICIINPFCFNVRNKQGVVLKRGLGFGLQSAMIVADDTEFGGGTVDPAKAFAGVKIDSDVNPSAMFDQTAAGGSDRAAAVASLFD